MERDIVEHMSDKGTLPDDQWGGPGWYFWDETWAYAHGPFATAKECRANAERYARWLDTEEELSGE